jgi:hypothetical protein
MQCPPHRRTITGQLPMGPTMDQRAMGHLTITAGHLPITDKRATGHLTMTDKGAMGHRHGRRVGMAIARIRLRIRHRM